jgi:hypothetical protein
MSTDLDVVTKPWDRFPDEPIEWYNIFKQYYLVLGSRRSIRLAFEFYLRVENPAHHADIDPNDVRYVPQHWNEAATRYSWAERALSYDDEKIPDFSELYVQTALEYLRENAMEAAKALVEALKNERTRVQAANSILNRSGVPEISEILFKAGVIITSDDMAAASGRIEEWQKKRSLSG